MTMVRYRLHGMIFTQQPVWKLSNIQLLGYDYYKVGKCFSTAMDLVHKNSLDVGEDGYIQAVDDDHGRQPVSTRFHIQKLGQR